MDPDGHAQMKSIMCDSFDHDTNMPDGKTKRYTAQMAGVAAENKINAFAQHSEQKGSVKFGFEDGKMVITTEDTKTSLVPKASKSKKTPNPVFVVGKSPVLDLERSNTFHPWFSKALYSKALFAKTLFACARLDSHFVVPFKCT